MRHLYGYICNVVTLLLQKMKELAWRFNTGRVKNTRYMSLFEKINKAEKTYSWTTLSYLCFWTAGFHDPDDKVDDPIFLRSQCFHIPDDYHAFGVLLSNNQAGLNKNHIDSLDLRQ